MPRRAYKIDKQRKIAFNTTGNLMQKFINEILRDGKSRLAQNIVYSAIEEIAQNSNAHNASSIHVLRQGVLNVTPLVELKARRIGASVYQVPIEVHSERGTVLAVRWIVQSARNRAGRGMASKLAAELMDASQNTGSAMKKREDLHRMAEANKAFAHYRTHT